MIRVQISSIFIEIPANKESFLGGKGSFLRGKMVFVRFIVREEEARRILLSAWGGADGRGRACCFRLL